MYGVAADLNLSEFTGATLTQIAIGEYQLQFHFHRSSNGKTCHAEISVEGKWQLRDSLGSMLDSCERTSLPYSQKSCHSLQVLLGQSVAATSVDPPTSFSLRFSSGYTLQIYDDSTEFESFSIQPGDVFV